MNVFTETLKIHEASNKHVIIATKNKGNCEITLPKQIREPEKHHSRKLHRSSKPLLVQDFKYFHDFYLEFSDFCHLFV